MLSATDNIVFDGQKISRTGIFPRLWAYINGRKVEINVDSINQIETNILLTLKKAKKVSYIYKTVVCGLESCLIFVSSENENYRALMKNLTKAVHKETLDFKSSELGKYALEKEKVLEEARILNLFPEERLSGNLQFNPLVLKNHEEEVNDSHLSDNLVERLRRVATELKILGYLPQALEAFRRSLLLKPKDAWLRFEYSCCLWLFAESEKSKELAKKAEAHRRLARMHGKHDAELLVYLGEAYLQQGDLKKAKETFNQVLAISEESYRAFLGLAEIALREGKIAQIIHYLTAAHRVAKTDTFKRWTSKEMDYFIKLNSDLSYVEKEISRINWLGKIHLVKKLTMYTFLAGFPLIVYGSFYNEPISVIGWNLSMLSILSWIGLNASASFLSQRTPL